MRFFRKRQITQAEAEIEYRERFEKQAAREKYLNARCARCGSLRFYHEEGCPWTCLLFLEPEGVE